MKTIYCPHCGKPAAVVQFNEPTIMPVVPDPVATTEALVLLVDEYPWPKNRLRIRFACRNNNITTFSELCQKTEAELLRTPNFGQKSIDVLNNELGKLGLQLGMES